MSNPTILIVEDEAIVATDLALKLQRLGYEICATTGRGEQAVALARAHDPDLVLMDIRLAGAMDGVETAEHLRAECDVPVIYLTAHSDRATLERAKVTEAFGYILKPFETRELETHIQMGLYKHRAEQTLREAHAKLQAHAEDLEKIVARRTAKLQETVRDLEHFSYTLSHDLRSPLRAMQGFAELIEEECAGCERTRSQTYFNRIKIAAARLDVLITDALNYSKAVRQELTLEPVDLDELLNGIVETYPNLQPDKADIKLESHLPGVLGNQAALTQCFSNLLDNAVKFARPGTKSRVRVRAQLGPQSTSNSHPSSGFVRVWVEDDGIGIPKNAHERIFGLFERIANDREGTGLGLAIVRKVVHRMGGNVGVESEEGRGSRFWVDLLPAPPAALAPPSS